MKNIGSDFVRHIKSYWVPYGVAAFLLGVATCIFGKVFWCEMFNTFRDPKWLAQSTVTLFAFTFLVNWVASIGRKRQEARSREPFEGWTLTVKKTDDEDAQADDLYWQDVERFVSSKHEYWKFIRSNTSPLRINTRDGVAAQNSGWLSHGILKNATTKNIVMVIDKIPQIEISL